MNYIDDWKRLELSRCQSSIAQLICFCNDEPIFIHLQQWMKCLEMCDEEQDQSQSYSITLIFSSNGGFRWLFGIEAGTAVEWKGDEGIEVEDKLRGVGWIGTERTGVEGNGDRWGDKRMGVKWRVIVALDRVGIDSWFGSSEENE